MTDFGELSRAVEYRSRRAQIIGQHFHIYASLKRASSAIAGGGDICAQAAPTPRARTSPS